MNRVGEVVDSQENKKFSSLGGIAYLIVHISTNWRSQLAKLLPQTIHSCIQSSIITDSHSSGSMMPNCRTTGGWNIKHEVSQSPSPFIVSHFLHYSSEANRLPNQFLLSAAIQRSRVVYKLLPQPDSLQLCLLVFILRSASQKSTCLLLLMWLGSQKCTEWQNMAWT